MKSFLIFDERPGLLFTFLNHMFSNISHRNKSDFTIYSITYSSLVCSVLNPC